MSSLSSRKRSRGTKPRYPRKRQRGTNPQFPPSFSPVIHVLHRYRFYNTATESKGSAAIVNQHCINNLLWFAQTTTVGQAIYASSRLRRVEVWGVPNPTGFTSVAIEWSGANTPNITQSSTGDNVQPPYLSMRPPQNSLASFWINPAESGTTNQELFALSAPLGSICDVTVEHTVLDNDNSETTYALTTVGATAGVIYFNELDSTTNALGASAGDWTPVSVASMKQAWG
jgi:hypothetical protein